MLQNPLDDTYQTIETPSEALFKDRGSKFFGFAYPIRTDEEAKEYILMLRELHPKAVHHCYAYRLGLDKMRYRASDDGEPSGTAGKPILNVLYSRNLTNVLIVVVRYFGGTLLGVPGLINAYRVTTEETLDATEVCTKYVTARIKVTFSYERMNVIMKIVKEMNLPTSNQIFEMQCSLEVEVRESLKAQFLEKCENAGELDVEEI